MYAHFELRSPLVVVVVVVVMVAPAPRHERVVPAQRRVTNEFCKAFRREYYERRFAASHIISVDIRPCLVWLVPHSELVTRGGKAISGNYAKSHSNKSLLQH